MTGCMEDDFQQFVERYVDAWSSGEFSRVKALWDPDCEEPWHFPEELDTPIVGWEQLDAYLAAAGEIIRDFKISVSDGHVKHLADGLALFRFQMEWTAIMNSNSVFRAPIGAPVRVSGVLRGTADGMKLMHYMEAGPAALPYIIKTYEAFAKR